MSVLNWYIAHQAELLEKYNGKIIAISRGKVLGDFPSKLDALRYIQEKGITPGDFMIIKCSPGDSEYKFQVWWYQRKKGE